MIYKITYINVRSGTEHERAFDDWGDLVDHLRLAPHTPNDQLLISTSEDEGDEDE